MKIKYFSFILFFLLFLNLVSCENYIWAGFGGNNNRILQTQTSGYSFFNLTNITTHTLSIGQVIDNTLTEVVVSNLNEEYKNYLIFTNNNFIKIYNSNLNSILNYNTTYISISQVNLVDWNNDNVKSELAGFFRVNDSAVKFMVYNYTNNNLTLLYNYTIQFNYTNNGVSNIKCNNNSCYTVVWDNNGSKYKWYFFDASINNIKLKSIYNSYSENYYPLESLDSVDWDNNGVNDFLAFTEEKVTIFDYNTNIIREFEVNRVSGGMEYIRNAKFFESNSGNYNFIIVYDVPYQTSSSLRCNNNYACTRIKIVKISDGSVVSSPLCRTSSSSSDNTRLQGSAIVDYNNDGLEDYWCLATSTTSNSISLKIYAYDGSQISSTSFSASSNNQPSYPNSFMTVGKMDNDSYYDIIYNYYFSNLYREIFVYSPHKNIKLYHSSVGFNKKFTCIPADLNHNSFLDIICSSDSLTYLFSGSNLINHNSNITSITFNPGTTVNVNQVLNIYVGAEDEEGDTIYYSFKCSNNDSFSNYNINNNYSCQYSSVGNYNFSVKVKDDYHNDSEASIYNQIITVSSSSQQNGGGGGDGSSSYNPPQNYNTLIVIVGVGNNSWSMQTEGGKSLYQLNMIQGTSRSKDILFENLGTKVRKIKLKCVDIVGDLCMYVNIKDKSFDLKPLQDTKIAIPITITIPQNFEKGKYKFNIVGVDDLNQEGAITFDVNVGEFSFIVNILTKLVSFKKMNNIKIPYLLIFLFILIFISFFINYTIFKPLKLPGGFSILIGLLVSSIIIYLI